MKQPDDLIPQAVIDLAADIAHAGAVVTHHEHPPAAGLVEIAPLGLALLEVFIHIALHFHKMGRSLVINQSPGRDGTSRHPAT